MVNDSYLEDKLNNVDDYPIIDNEPDPRRDDGELLNNEIRTLLDESNS